MKLETPMLIKALGNKEENGFARARRRKKQRSHVAMLWRNAYQLGRRAPALPVVVMMTRIGPKELDDDNLATSLKSIRDEVASRLGLKNDKGPEVRWVPLNGKGTQGLVIEIRHDVERCDEFNCRSCAGAAA